jgi:hypothetical protein
MSKKISAELHQLWRAWIKSKRPFIHLATGSKRHVLYAIELQLDHTESYIKAWFGLIIDGQPVFPQVIEDEIQQLDSVLLELSNQSKNAKIDELQEFARQTRLLAIAIKEHCWSAP